ncbi:MAG: hypothetical protein RI897_562 [Verrucomicrobiota bacterium]
MKLPPPQANQKRLRILLVNSLLGGGGTDDRSVRLAVSLHKRGHAVALAGQPQKTYAIQARDQGLQIIPTTSRKRSRIIVVARALRQQRYDILQAHHGRDYWPAIAAAYLSCTRPAIVFVRHLAKSPSGFSRLFLLSQCDAMVGVSEFVASLLRQGASDPQSKEPERHYRPRLRGNLSKIHAIHGAFDLQRFHPQSSHPLRQAWNMDDTHFVFGVVGTYPPPRGKGQREFLQAAAQIAQQLPNARFAIIGRGKLRPVLEEDISRLNLSGRVTLVDWSNSMPDVMNTLNCLVHPQVATEALPGVIIEAHASGIPVIATTIDGNPEAFECGGLGRLVQPESIEDLASAMIEVASQPALQFHERLVLHEKLKAEYSAENACRRFEELYEKILS